MLNEKSLSELQSLAKYLSRKYTYRGASIDDLESACLNEIPTIERLYDPSKNTKLRTYAYTKFRYAILKCIKDNTYYKTNEDVLENQTKKTISTFFKTLDIFKTIQNTHNLTEQEKAVLKARLGDSPVHFKVLATMMNVNVSTVCACYKKALQKFALANRVREQFVDEEVK